MKVYSASSLSFGLFVYPVIVGSRATRLGEGTYVSDIAQCPKLKPRTTGGVHDIRPDQFSVVAAIGDSITAGCFAKGLHPTNPLLHAAEWRGVSYAGGGDSGAITLPNLFRHYNHSVQGGALGYNIFPEVCSGTVCPPGSIGWNSTVDQLNAAQSGALAFNLYHEVRDYLIPQIQQREIPDNAFKYVSLQIGSNDICQLCMDVFMKDGSGVWSDEQTPVGYWPRLADEFEAGVRSALEYIRLNLPNTLVNVFGVFRVSDIYQLTKRQPHCQKLIPILPHSNIECSCALLEGPVGDYTRHQMDWLQEQYSEKNIIRIDERLISVVRSYQRTRHSSFAVAWQPPVVPLSTYPIEALSDVDCFHPSTLTHERIATALWNRLTGNATTRATPFVWEPEPLLRCLEEEDRIHTKGS